MKKELLSVSLMCCLLAFQHATPAKAQAAGKAGGNRNRQNNRDRITVLAATSLTPTASLSLA